MATTPQTTPSGFTPFFKRVSQGDDRHADIFAVCAMLTNKSLGDIQRCAEGFGVPRIGPYYPFCTDELVAKILIEHGLVATVWGGECFHFDELPDVSIAMIEYKSTAECGRCVLFHRQRMTDGKVTPYVVDPYPHSDAKLHLRVGKSELSSLTPSWYIGVHQAKPSAKG
jgi:hypothetical protein